MIKITDICGDTYWINARHIVQIEYREVSEYMYENYSDLIEGLTHYTLIKTVDNRDYEVNATVEQLLKLIQPYLGGE